MTRVVLLLIVVTGLGLATHASLLTPLYELPDEFEHMQVATHWARGGGMPDLRRPTDLSPRHALQPPVPAWIHALGLHALGLADVRFLHRPADGAEPGVARFLHGADELFPFAGPVARLHVLRLLGLAALLATLLGTYQLALRVTPSRPGVALGAAALVALQPVVLQRSVALSHLPLAVALCTWSLVGVADVAARRTLTGRRAFVFGLLLAGAQIVARSALLLLPVGLFAVLLRRRRGEDWRETLQGLDRLVAGFILVTGPWYAWNITRYGGPLAASVMPPGETPPTWVDGVMNALLADWASYGAGHSVGGPALVAGVFAVLGGALGLLYWKRSREEIDVRVWLLLMFAWVLNLATSAGTVLPASSLHLTVAPLACVLAAGWGTWVPRPVGVAAVLALGLLAFRSQTVDLGPAYWPPARAADPHFMAVDPFESLPEGIDLDTVEAVEWSWPRPDERHVRAPRLTWKPDAHHNARYTVHLIAPDRRLSLRTYEDRGLALRDNFQVPADLWDELPTGARLYCQVLRLPRRDEVQRDPGSWRGPVQHSSILLLNRVRPDDDLRAPAGFTR